MKCCRFCLPMVAIVGIAALTASISFAQTGKDKTATKPTAPPSQDMPELPPGMTEEDMEHMMVCIAAATPGEMHYYLTESVGVWQGKTTMWMNPEAEAVKSECTSTITSMMDGRFIKCETAGEMPGMGSFNGFGVYGFDNVSQEFQSTWMDNFGTGMATGKGELSSDGKTLTWTFTYNCPITKKPITFRQVDRRTGKDTSTMQMYMTDLKSGKEFKTFEVALTRKPGSGAAASADTLR